MSTKETMMLAPIKLYCAIGKIIKHDGTELVEAKSGLFNDFGMAQNHVEYLIKDGGYHKDWKFTVSEVNLVATIDI